MNNSYSFSLMLVSQINPLERVHIREFPICESHSSFLQFAANI